ncbi:hypothetical protein HDV00_006644 [Rhizophlyctis rosea]|nr:hypothetical protein HDV00_006644 [Rhizophlyctis rosea]
MAFSSTDGNTSIASGGTVFGHMLLQDHLSDIGLEVPTAAGMVKFPAPKVILACRSPYFCAMFASGCSEATTSTHTTVVHLKDFTPDVIRSILEFIYTNTLSTHQPADLPAHLDLLRAADYFQMSDLHAHVANRTMDNHLSSTSALSIFAFAIQYQGASAVLAERVKGWIRGQWDELVKEAEFGENMKEVESSVIAAVFE